MCGKPTAETWTLFVLIDEVLGQRPSNNPPVLIASIPEETPEPSSAVGDREEDEPAPTPGKKKWGREDELLRENIRFQRETEERRAQESRERMDRLFSLLERMVDK